MHKTFSSQPRKQRLQRLTAPHHRARKQVAGHLSEELLLRYNRRSLSVIKGDEVKLMRGGKKGKIGKVIGVDTRARKVTVDGVTHKKADGTEVAFPVDPSNLLIIKLNLEDARRRTKLETTAKAAKGEPKVQKASKAGQPRRGAKPAGKKDEVGESPASAKPDAGKGSQEAPGEKSPEGSPKEGST